MGESAAYCQGRWRECHPLMETNSEDGDWEDNCYQARKSELVSRAAGMYVEPEATI